MEGRKSETLMRQPTRRAGAGHKGKGWARQVPGSARMAREVVRKGLRVGAAPQAGAER
jgi:hypothetical protein